MKRIEGGREGGREEEEEEEEEGKQHLDAVLRLINTFLIINMTTSFLRGW